MNERLIYDIVIGDEAIYRLKRLFLKDNYPFYGR